MKPYNVEIFDWDMNFKSNTVIDSFAYKKDYIAPENYEIVIEQNVEIEETDWVNVRTKGRDFLGLVERITELSDGTKRVSLKDPLTLFDVEFYYDLAMKEPYVYLERFINAFTYNMYRQGAPKWYRIRPIQNMKLDITEEVDEWYFEIKTISEETNTAVINVFDSIVLPAFVRYGIVVKIYVNHSTNNLVFYVMKPNYERKTIEADLENVISKEINVQKNKGELTKLIVINRKNYKKGMAYFRHEDGTIDTVETGEIFPPVFRIEFAEETKEDDVVVRRFEDNAKILADSVFEQSKKYNNIIIEVLEDDELIKPLEWEIGQEAEIISNGKTYLSVFTGFEMKDGHVRMIFGNMRYELTKILKGRA